MALQEEIARLECFHIHPQAIIPRQPLAVAIEQLGIDAEARPCIYIGRGRVGDERQGGENERPCHLPHPIHHPCGGVISERTQTQPILKTGQWFGG